MKKKFVTTLCLLWISVAVYSQSADIEKGDAYFDFFQFNEASQYYENALKANNIKTEAYVLDRLAQCYKFTFQYKKAEATYARLVRLGDKKMLPDVYLDYGAILKINGDYTGAKEQFRYFLSLYNNDPYATFQLKSLAWAEKNLDSVRNFTVTPTNLNVSGQSVGYCFFDDGMIYSTMRKKSPTASTSFLDLDFAVRNDSVTFTDGDKIMEDISFELNEGSPSVTDDGLLVYFSANAIKIEKGVVKKNVRGIEVSSDGASNLKIYVAKFENGKFVSPQELPFNNKEYNCMHPCITDNGNTLYFVSDMPKGFGGLDLYRVKRESNGTWGKPENLGQTVNTSENEMYPFVSSNVFFFASKGFNGFGGYDLYQSKMTFGIPGAPINMGQPFNSSHDDVAFVCHVNGRTGYFTSNRDNGEGIDKVYFFIDNKYIGDSKPVLATADTIKSKTQPVVAVVPVPAKPTEPAKANKPVKAGQINEELLSLVFDKVHFRFNETEVPASSYITLDSVITLSQTYAALKVMVSAHTDSRGSTAYNQQLSEKRAAAVKKYLVKKGMSPEYIITKGLGESQPLNTCSDGVTCTEEQHQENRRVEIKIVK